MARKAPNRAKKATETPIEDIDLQNPEFVKAKELLEHTHQSIFLTGKAGTGKSTFLRYITTHTRKKHIILAPTGIAAVNVGGQTIHSFFKIPLKPIMPDDPDFARDRIRKRMKYSGELIRTIRELDLIIIDEISMVRADIVDFIDLLLRTYSGNNREPFGGKQLLLVGDVFQLEPVVTSDMRDILRRYYSNAFFFSAHVFERFGLVPIELRKIYRQTEGEFIGILDRIRTASATVNDLQLLNSRCLPETAEEELRRSEPVMTLASRRDMVDHINESRLEAIDRPLFKFTGTITGDFPENSLPTDAELSLKEGAQVVFIKNAPDKQWVNGTLATVVTLTADRIEVKLENGDLHTIEPEKWSNIRYTFNPETKKIDEKELGSFTQYPIKLAWALTIHKSQGLTFNNVIIDIGRGAFTGGQIYVALSRCRSLEGLILRSTVAERDIFVNPAVVRFSHTFNSPQLIDGALRKAHADECLLQALHAADNGDLAKAFDLFIEAAGSSNVIDNEPVMRLARKKLNIVNRLRERIDSLQEEIDSNRVRFADMAAEYISLGDDCRVDEMPQPAIANYEKALTLVGREPQALSGRGKALMDIGEFEKALKDFEELLKIEPDNIDAIIRMASAYFQLSDVHNALDRCMLALSLSETVEVPRSQLRYLHTLLGDIYENIGDTAMSEHHRAIAKRLR